MLYKKNIHEQEKKNRLEEQKKGLNHLVQKCTRANYVVLTCQANKIDILKLQSSEPIIFISFVYVTSAEHCLCRELALFHSRRRQTSRNRFYAKMRGPQVILTFAKIILGALRRLCELSDSLAEASL